MIITGITHIKLKHQAFYRFKAMRRWIASHITLVKPLVTNKLFNTSLSLSHSLLSFLWNPVVFVALGIWLIKDPVECRSARLAALDMNRCWCLQILQAWNLQSTSDWAKPNTGAQSFYWTTHYPGRYDPQKDCSAYLPIHTAQLKKKKKKKRLLK